MRWQSPTSRKVGAVLLLVYLCASALVAVELERRRHDAAAQLDDQRSRNRELAQTIGGLDRELARAAAPAPVSSASERVRAPAEQAAAVVQLMRSADSNFGVRWRTLSLGGGANELAGVQPNNPRADRGIPVAAMFSPLPEVPQLQAARLRAEGDYRSLAGLLDMIDSLKRQGAAVTELALEGEQVTLSGYVVAGIR